MGMIPARVLRTSLFGAALGAALSAAAVAAEPECPLAPGYTPWIRDADTAIKIAKVVVERATELPPFGESRPLTAQLRGDTWAVSVDWKACFRRPPGACRDGRAPVVKIRRDGWVKVSPLASPAAKAPSSTCPEADKAAVQPWVRDAETAIEIAKAVVEGSRWLTQFDESRPLEANLYGDTWEVSVDISECLREPDPPDARWICRGGGTPAVRVRRDGRVQVYPQRE